VYAGAELRLGAGLVSRPGLASRQCLSPGQSERQMGLEPGFTTNNNWS